MEKKRGNLRKKKEGEFSAQLNLGNWNVWL
jgi:hypothetical protein